MKPIYFLLYFLIFTTSCKPYIKIFCEKGNPKSIVIIDKKKPFEIYETSIKKKVSLITENLKKININSNFDVERNTKPIIEKINSKDFIKYTAIWTAFKADPCKEQLKNKFTDNLLKVLEYDEQVNKALSISESLKSSDGIGGKDSTELFTILKNLANEDI